MLNQPPIKYNSRKLENLFRGEGKQETYIVCEIGINHNGSLSKALSLIDEAYESNVDAVKFQKRDLESIYSEGILSDSNSAEWSFDYIIPLLRECELSKNDFLQIKERCKKLKLDLIVTPFDIKSANFVASLDPAAIKISSADMTNIDLVRHCARLCSPLLISTGMWTRDDIAKCSEIFKNEGFKFALLHAQSTYPAPFESINLGFIHELKKMAEIVGYSGHERGTFIPVAAVTLGCRIIEKHITFDRNDKGPDHKASMLPGEWKEMVTNIRLLEKSLGANKEVNQAEIQNRELFAKSAVVVKSLRAGHVLTSNDVVFKSPGKGIFPHLIDKYYGLSLKRNVASGTYLASSDFDVERLICGWKSFDFRQEWGVKCRFHDFEEYKALNTPVVEFHCSQTDLDIPFEGGSERSALVVHAPEIFDRELVDICTDDEAKVSLSLQILQRSIDKTLEIAKNFPAQKPKLVVHLGGMFLDSPARVDTEILTLRAIDNFRQLVYSPDQLEILPENLPPRPWYLGGEWHQYGFMKAEDMVSFCQALGLGMAYDICHAFLYCNLYGVDFLEYTQKVMPYAQHLHLSDAAGINGEGLQIGDGELDFPLLLKLLRNWKFSWVPEIWSGHLHHGAGVYSALVALEEFGEGL